MLFETCHPVPPRTGKFRNNGSLAGGAYITYAEKRDEKTVFWRRNALLIPVVRAHIEQHKQMDREAAMGKKPAGYGRTITRYDKCGANTCWHVLTLEEAGDDLVCELVWVFDYECVSSGAPCRMLLLARVDHLICFPQKDRLILYFLAPPGLCSHCVRAVHGHLDHPKRVLFDSCSLAKEVLPLRTILVNSSAGSVLLVMHTPKQATVNHTRSSSDFGNEASISMTQLAWLTT